MSLTSSLSSCGRNIPIETEQRGQGTQRNVENSTFRTNKQTTNKTGCQNKTLKT